MISIVVLCLRQKLILVSLFALYVCIVPFQTQFEKWLVFMREITKGNTKENQPSVKIYHDIPDGYSKNR